MPKNQLFAPQSEVDAWMSSGIVKNREVALAKLMTPLRRIVRTADRTDELASAEHYVNVLSRSNIITLGQLVCLGAAPTYNLRNVKTVNANVFKRALNDFWPNLQLPSLPSPDIAASIHPNLRSVPAFPWIIDCLGRPGEYQVGERYMPGIAPPREQYWTVELLLSIQPRIARHIFESYQGRWSEVRAYYQQYAEQFDYSSYKPTEVTYFDEPAIAFGANGQIIVE